MLSVENNKKLLKNDALGISELLTLFEYDQTTASIPFRPKGGDLFIFKSERKDDWKADGHTWINQGSKKPLPRSGPKYLKSYFYIKTGTGKCDKNFRREVYFPVENPQNVAVVHYIGDESLSAKAPHGNAKHEKPFFRTQPSVDLRLSRDAIYNTHEIAYEGGFIHYIVTYPDLAIIAGSQGILNELNTIIKLKDKEFLFSYDTTFSLGEFYVSPLVFKHILFEKNPLVAALFLIHERKLQETHDVLFKRLGSLVKSLKELPIVTDMESAIVRSIKENTALCQMGCWRHLRQDVQRWLTDNLPRVQRNDYVNDLYEILRSTQKDSCFAKIEQKKSEKWDPAFARYFEKNIEPKLEYFCFWSIHGKCPYDEVNGLTTNQSEGFNFLLKDFQNWKEVPLDCLLMSLKLIQGFHEEECRRGKMGLGNFSLKSRYKQFKTDAENFQPRTLVCHPKDIVTSIRNRDFIAHDFANDLVNKHASSSRIVRAKELVAQDLIAFSPRLGAENCIRVFIVWGIINTIYHL